MRKLSKFLASLVLVLLSVVVLTACGSDTYTVTFNSNGGTAVENYISTDGHVVKPTDPTKKNYNFGGWYEDVDLTDPFEFDTETIDKDTTLYAKWLEIITYKVSFEENGGNLVPNQKVEEGKTATAPTISRDDYNLTGWYTDEALTKLFDFSTPITSDITLYAGWESAIKLSTIAELIPIIDALGSGNTSTEYYYLKATISEITNATYGNMIVTDDSTETTFTIYGSYSEDGETRFDALETQPKVGDVVTYYGQVMNYTKSSGETVYEMVNARMLGYGVKEEETPVLDPTIPTDPIDSNVSKDDLHTVAEIIKLAADYTETSEERFYVQARVVSIDDPTYGQMTISDGTGTISIYGSYSADGTLRYSELEEKPYANDIVLIYGTIHTFKGEPEISSGWIIAFEKGEDAEFDVNNYTEMSIAEAREKDVDSLVKVDGVVAAYTYNAANNPIGFILVDESSSIYVYDNQLAVQVKVGNKIEIAASRDNWILAGEQSNANKFGYDGCIQLVDGHLLSNDKGTNDWDKTWVEESTVKAMLDADVSVENNTTKIYKVNALVKEVPGNGFTNFYFFDIDGNTGSYAYSQASGEDFTWLREFDGKICTVYLMVLNYKSESSGVFARLLPVYVVDEGYQFDLSTTAQTVLDYYVNDQFKVTKFYADPALELVASVSNDTLGFENAVVTYTASDSAITFTLNEAGNYVMNVDVTNSKDVTVTAKITYDTQEVTKEYTISILSLESFNYINVTEAIAADIDSTITVRGIVGPSLVNRDGFYLMDDEAMIAILTTSDVLSSVHIGDEIILSGRREQFRKDGTTAHGQTSIVECELLVNLYGNHEIPTSYFIEGKDLAYLYNLDANEDHSTEGYIVTATINYVETAYYTTLNLTDGTTTYNLYMSGAGQYSWLQDYYNQEVTMVIAPCNWNDKNYYRGCILMLMLEDGTVLYNTSNF